MSLIKSNYFEKYGFRIDEDGANEEEMKYLKDRKMTELLLRENRKVARGVKGAIKRIKTLIGKNSGVPQLYFLLTSVYMEKQQFRQAIDVAKEMVDKFPDYFAGRNILATLYGYTDQAEHVPSVLGEDFFIGNYRESKCFTSDEICEFYATVFSYWFLDEEDYVKAKKIANLLEDTDPNHPRVYQCLLQMRLQEERDNYIQDEIPEKTYNPAFNSPLIFKLYENDMEISDSILKEILALPRANVIEDLGEVLRDFIENEAYYEYQSKTGQKGLEELFFPIHATFLLTELKAVEMLPLVFEAHNKDCINSGFIYEDHSTESLEYDYYCLGKDDFSTLGKLLETEQLDRICAGVLLSTLQRIVREKPEKRSELIEILSSKFNRFLEQDTAGEVIDKEFIGFLVVECGEGRFKELIPEIEQLGAAHLIDENVTSATFEIEQMSREAEEMRSFNYSNIYERYTYYQENWYAEVGYEGIDFDDFKPMPSVHSNETVTDPFAPVKAKPKVGRNEPCPCGSGKKYKKCCLNK